MELERTSLQLSRTRTDLQNASKTLSDRDTQIFLLKDRIKSLEQEHQRQLLQIEQE